MRQFQVKIALKKFFFTINFSSPQCDFSKSAKVVFNQIRPNSDLSFTQFSRSRLKNSTKKAEKNWHKNLRNTTFRMLHEHGFHKSNYMHKPPTSLPRQNCSLHNSLYSRPKLHVQAIDRCSIYIGTNLTHKKLERPTLIEPGSRVSARPDIYADEWTSDANWFDACLGSTLHSDIVSSTLCRNSAFSLSQGYIYQRTMVGILSFGWFCHCLQHSRSRHLQKANIGNHLLATL